MDYTKNIETVKRIIADCRELKDKIANNEKNARALLRKNLDDMTSELESKNTSYTKLNNDEQEVILYVESGKYQEALKNMPSIERDSHKKRIDGVYSQSKRKIVNQESKLVGYLTTEKKENAFLINVQTPIREKSKGEQGSISEMLYEHHINVGNFSGEINKNGYVAFFANAKAAEINEKIKDITSRLPNDLPPALKGRGISYEVVVLDELGLSLENNSDNLEEREEGTARIKSECPKRSTEQIAEDISVQDAVKLLDLNEKAIGYHVSKGNLVRTGSGFISAGSFNYFINNYHKKNDRWVRKNHCDFNGPDAVEAPKKKWLPKKYSAAAREEKEAEEKTREIKKRYHASKAVGTLDADKTKIKLVPETRKEIPVSEVATMLGIDNSTVRNYVNEDRLTRTKLGYVSIKSINNFRRNNIKAGSDNRTYWLPKKAEPFEGKETVTMREAARRLDISNKTIKRMIEDGEIQKGGESAIILDSIKEFIKNHKKGGGRRQTIWLLK